MAAGIRRADVRAMVWNWFENVFVLDKIPMVRINLSFQVLKKLKHIFIQTNMLVH